MGFKEELQKLYSATEDAEKDLLEKVGVIEREIMLKLMETLGETWIELSSNPGYYRLVLDLSDMRVYIEGPYRDKSASELTFRGKLSDYIISHPDCLEGSHARRGEDEEIAESLEVLRKWIKTEVLPMCNVYCGLLRKYPDSLIGQSMRIFDINPTEWGNKGDYVITGIRTNNDSGELFISYKSTEESENVVDALGFNLSRRRFRVSPDRVNPLVWTKRLHEFYTEKPSLP
jgi:hypothetical protein